MLSLKGWEKRGKRRLTRAAARLLRARGNAGEIPRLGTLSRILLVRQQNQLGDMLLGTPALRAVRAAAPDAVIDLVCSPQNAAAVVGSRRVDEVLVYDKAAMVAHPLLARRFLGRLREARYELALVLSTVSFSYTSAWIAALSGAHRRAGRPGPEGQGQGVAADVYDWVLPDPLPGRHQTAVNLDLVAPFGAGPDPGAPEIFPAPEEAEAGRAALEEAIGGRRERVALLHPGAGKLPNRWPAERFGELGARLWAEGWTVVTCAGPGETRLLDRADGAAGTPFPRLRPLDFRSLSAALGAADLCVVNDTGVLHLSAASGANTLALFGPTDPMQWCPAAPNVGVVRAPGGDLSRLPVAAVFEAATVRGFRSPSPRILT